MIIIKPYFALSIKKELNFTENTLELRTVNELSQYSFYIPSYQRGYRWTQQEVRDLLDDIDEFRPREIESTDDKTWYCLQPVVVKAIESNKFEVIDGQQRLTTIYLILHYLNQDFVEASRDKLFTIDYQTREIAKDFLSDPGIEDDSNIDFFHIGKAYKAIVEWFLQKDTNFDRGAFRSKFKFNTKVIWYESTENEPISVFTRLNIGKINLSNSELIKALFLNSSNFDKKINEKMRQRQFEIAAEWDGIEGALQNNRFWFFLTDKNYTDNRIEYIFNLMNDSESSDAYSTFRYFNKKLKPKTQKIIDDNWQEIKAYYQRLSEWFHERNLYHKIGFILCAEITNVATLYTISSSIKKKAFVAYLDDTIKKHYRKVNLNELQYDDKITKSVLLLYNIITMLQNSHDYAYFPFDTFKMNNWNIEHIASIKYSMPKNNRLEWLTDVKCYINTDQQESAKLIQRIENCDDPDNNEIFTLLFEDIIDHFNQYIDADDVNSISNLALLDENTNKGYKNAVFPLKRKTIIDLDKSGEFVPLCTKNVFLKYFSDYPPKISFWTQDDRNKYEEDLQRVLKDYMEVTE